MLQTMLLRFDKGTFEVEKERERVDGLVDVARRTARVDQGGDLVLARRTFWSDDDETKEMPMHLDPLTLDRLVDLKVMNPRGAIATDRDGTVTLFDLRMAREWNTLAVLSPPRRSNVRYPKDLVEDNTAISPDGRLFAVVFALNSALHSYLILAFTDGDRVTMDVGFYYMSNAAGRLLGTLLSGLTYQLGGVALCLATAAAMAALSALAVARLDVGPDAPDTALH